MTKKTKAAIREIYFQSMRHAVDVRSAGMAWKAGYLLARYVHVRELPYDRSAFREAENDKGIAQNLELRRCFQEGFQYVVDAVYSEHEAIYGGMEHWENIHKDKPHEKLCEALAQHLDDLATNKTLLCADGWAGRIETPCTILKETPKRFLVRVDADCSLPGRHVPKGRVLYIPKYAVRGARLAQEPEITR
jgi:hypothetical protein